GLGGATVGAQRREQRVAGDVAIATDDAARTVPDQAVRAAERTGEEPYFQVGTAGVVGDDGVRQRHRGAAVEDAAAAATDGGVAGDGAVRQRHRAALVVDAAAQVGAAVLDRQPGDACGHPAVYREAVHGIVPVHRDRRAGAVNRQIPAQRQR